MVGWPHDAHGGEGGGGGGGGDDGVGIMSWFVVLLLVGSCRASHSSWVPWWVSELELDRARGRQSSKKERARRQERFRRGWGISSGLYCDCLAVSCFDDRARPCYIIAGCGHCGPLNLGIAWPNDLPTWAAWVAWVYGTYQANQERVLLCVRPPLSTRDRCCVVGAAQVLQAAGTLRGCRIRLDGWST